MEELLEFLARALVDNPEAVSVEGFDEDDGTIVLEIHVAEEDVGKMIGRGGRTISSAAHRHARGRQPPGRAGAGRRNRLAVKVGRPHGLDGSFYVDAPLDKGATVLIGDKEFTVTERKGTDAKPIIRLSGIEDRDAAETLRGQTLTPGNGQRATGNDDDEWPIET